MAVKLSYFKLLAKGVSSMLVLEVSGTEWEGQPVEFSAWGELKGSGKCPFGQLPILETADAGIIAQSNAINAYIGRKKDMLGSSDREKAVNDMLVGMADDFYNDLSKNQNTVLAKDKVPQAEVDKMWASAMPARFACLEKLLDGKDKFTESGTTVGELTLFAMLHQMVLVKPEVLKPTANLSAFYSRLLALPAVDRVLSGKSPFGEVPAYFTN